MNIEECYEILEVDKSAPLEQVTQSYKDMVNIWHPDRFANNPRLMKKAEDRLKEINSAYEKLTAYLSSQEGGKINTDISTHRQTETMDDDAARYQDKSKYYDFQPEPEQNNQPEVPASQGKGIISGVVSFLSTLFRQIAAEVQTVGGEEKVGKRPQASGYEMRGGMGKSRGRGKGMGGSGGGRMGRGGMGRGRRR